MLSSISESFMIIIGKNGFFLLGKCLRVSWRLHCKGIKGATQWQHGASSIALMHRNAMRHADGTVNVGQYMDADLLAIKTTYECIKELKDELMRGHGEMTYDCEFRDTDTFSHWFLRELYDDVFHSGEWVLQENFANLISGVGRKEKEFMED